jgi:hypothetical protein
MTLATTRVYAYAQDGDITTITVDCLPEPVGLSKKTPARRFCGRDGHASLKDDDVHGSLRCAACLEDKL